jgi:hypothetical protein
MCNGEIMAGDKVARGEESYQLMSWVRTTPVSDSGRPLFG